jgi:OOP family OmpA-OmpF porin
MPHSIRSAAAFVVLLFVAAVASAQSSASPTLSQLSVAIDQARQQQVDALAPTNFQAANAAFQTAAHDAERGRDAAKVTAQINVGMNALQKANAAAASARETLHSAVATRTDALTANAPKLATEQWQKADARFREATAALEHNDVKGAQRRAAEADVLLRDVELVAIRNGVVNEARGRIAQADAAKVEKFAPRTLAAAKRYLAQAEEAVNHDRYDLTPATGLAAQASYEARHSIYLASLIEATLDKKGDEAGLEELILSWEQPLAQVATAVEVQARFDAGVPPVLQQLQTKTQEQAREVQELRRELEDRNGQIVALNAAMEKLETNLGGVSQERLALQRRVDAQESVRRSVATIETSFATDEAHVSRQGEDVVISLTGIRFPSGRSNIEAGNAALMNKVRDALAQFPDASLTVEGHTDSNGSDPTNLILSQDRADAVRQYIISNFGINPERISSIGYGEARPVANNETTEGRARNRRIDLIVHVSP